jgi:hypothetical protein
MWAGAHESVFCALLGYFSAGTQVASFGLPEITISALLDRAYGDGQGFCDLRGSQHMALAIENAPGLDKQARRVDFAGHDPFGLNFDPAFGENHAVESTANDYVRALDLPFDARPFTEDQCLAGDNCPLDLRLELECTGKLQCALQANGFI